MLPSFHFHKAKLCVITLLYLSEFLKPPNKRVESTQVQKTANPFSVAEHNTGPLSDCRNPFLPLLKPQGEHRPTSQLGPTSTQQLWLRCKQLGNMEEIGTSVSASRLVEMDTLGCLSLHFERKKIQIHNPLLLFKISKYILQGLERRLSG